MRTIPGWWVVFSAALLAQVPQSQTPPRDAAPATAAAGATLRGRVTAAATGQPLHRVRLTLNGGPQNPPTGVTDTRGEFEITDVPPGSYTLAATRAGYLTLQYGQRRPREAGRPIVVRAGDTIEKIEVAMHRGGVLAGRVFDDAGDAAPGVRVEALEHRFIRGRRVPVAAKIATTNDAGEYRLSGLEPGAYQLRASSREVWEADDAKATYVFATTYFPGVAGGGQAQNLTLAAGQEIGGLDFSLLAAREARITGVVQDATGAPIAGIPVHLSEIGRTIGGAILYSGSAGDDRTDPRGAFDFQKLAPGDYSVYAGGPNDTTNASLALEAGEVKHVVLTPAKAPSAAGTIVTETVARPPFAASRLAVEVVDADPAHLLPTWTTPRPQTPRPDWTFRFANLDGQYLFRVNGLPDGWMLKAVTVGGRDITDTPFRIARGEADVEGLQLVVTDKAARVEGDVVNRAGDASGDATVILFAQDRSAWGIASRFVRTARPDSHGRFSIGGVPPGIYRVIAHDYVAEGQWTDPEFLQALMRDAARLEISDGESKTVTLTIGGSR